MVSGIKFGQRTVLSSDPEMDREVPAMDFYLTFDGCLLSTGNKSRPEHVHKYRRRFHPQLKHLWDTDPTLNINPEAKEFGLKHRAESYARNGYNFVPLVERKWNYACSIDVLLLRPHGTGSILKSTDIDGQLATLFDALTMPRHADQLKGHETPGDDEKPFFCLLEDDSLITSAAVTTNVLLEETRDGMAGNAARGFIRARVHWPPKDLGYSVWA